MKSLEKFEELAKWFNSESGFFLTAEETRRVKKAIANIFGYHALQIGGDLSHDVLRHVRLANQTVVGLGEFSNANADLICSAAALPIKSEHIDLVYLPHILEFSVDPYKVIEESYRVLIPEGVLVISGFNPISVFGLSLIFSSNKKRVPWNGNFSSSYRMRKLLVSFGFECLTCDTFHFGRLSNLKGFSDEHRKKNVRWAFLNHFRATFNNVYIIVAKKKVEGLTPLKFRWRRGKNLVSDRAAKHSLGRNSANQ